MFGISLPELIIVFAVILLVFGPDKLPEIARTIGDLSGKFRKESDKIRRDFYNSVYTPAETFRQSIRDEIKQEEKLVDEVKNLPIDQLENDQKNKS